MTLSEVHENLSAFFERKMDLMSKSPNIDEEKGGLLPNPRLRLTARIDVAATAKVGIFVRDL